MNPDDNDIVFDRTIFDPVNLPSEGIFSWFSGGGQMSSVWEFLSTLWGIYSAIAFLLSTLFIIGIVYSYLRFNKLSEIENNQLLEAEQLWKQRYGAGTGDNQWQQIKDRVGSDDPNDWKLAIIEADIVLDRALSETGYAGNTVADKLKSLPPNQYTALQDAWDAHIIRNKIAHEGSDFVITQRIAKEAIAKFQRILHELGVM